MQCTQLACPHCGSTLNFGVEIAAGAAVDCLICMRTFAAEGPVHSMAPSEPVLTSANPLSIDSATAGTLSDAATETLPKASPAPTPAEGILVGKPHKSLQPSEITSVPAASLAPAPLGPPVEIPSMPPAPCVRKQQQLSTAATTLLLFTAFMLLIVVSAGIALAAWKWTSTADQPGNDNQLAGASAKNGENPKKNNNPAPKPADDDDDDIRAKIDSEVLQLTRKPVDKSGTDELDWETVTRFNINKQKLTGLDQEKINAAIDKGVAYLKRTQLKTGSWSHSHAVGYAAIGGLTLLECKVAADDPAVQNAAKFVRQNIGNLASTYELSLAILFLDRLGEPRDRPLIQGMALRLLSGQLEGGGWTYSCPLLPPQDMAQLYNFLQSNKRPDLLNPVGVGKTKSPSGIVLNPVRYPKSTEDPFLKFHDLVHVGAADTKKSSTDKPSVIAGVGDPANSGDAKAKPGTDPTPAAKLNPNLQSIPIVKNQGKKKGHVTKTRGGGDNSNTQFALLALWTARRHDVPTDHALLASYHRFMESANGDGGWGYMPGHGTTNTMTNVGLLGLAMGHGAAPEIIRFNPKNPRDAIIKPALQDPTIKRGLEALSRHIGQPSTDPKTTSFPMQNLYLLWSIERVAMLYDLKTIGGKDWYGWGAQILVHNQAADGHWNNHHYHGASPPINTCFALLFLRRSNLVQDLTNNLRLHSGIVTDK